MLAALAYGGLCIYANVKQTTATDQLKMPDRDQAGYSVYIRNTGSLYFTDRYDQYSNVEGSRTFILHGYWEMIGQKFKYRDGDIILSEAIFGEIEIKRRGKE